MGFTSVAVHVVWGIAIITATATVVPAALEASKTTRERQAEADELRRADEATAVDATRMVYDAIAQTLTIEANNTGDTVLDLDEQAFLVDGVLMLGAAGEVAGESASTLWMPGEQANFTLSGVAAAPARVLLVAQRPSADLVLASEGQYDEPPLGFSLGYGASNPRHFKDIALSSDGSAFTATAKMKNGGDTLVKDVLRIRNPGATDRAVAFTASQETNSFIEAMDWIVRDGETEVARLRYKDASPSATFTLASGATYSLDFRADLGDNSGPHNVHGGFGLRMVAT